MKSLEDRWKRIDNFNELLQYRTVKPSFIITEWTCTVICDNLILIEHFHVGGQKQYIFSPLEIRSIFMQNSFIVSALQHGCRENPLYSTIAFIVTSSKWDWPWIWKGHWLGPFSIENIWVSASSKFKSVPFQSYSYMKSNVLANMLEN